MSLLIFLSATSRVTVTLFLTAQVLQHFIPDCEFSMFYFKHTILSFHDENGFRHPTRQTTGFNVFRVRALYHTKALITNKCTKRVLSSIVTHSYMFRPCWVIFREKLFVTVTLGLHFTVAWECAFDCVLRCFWTRELSAVPAWLLHVSTLLGHLQGELFCYRYTKVALYSWVRTCTAVQAWTAGSSRLQKQRSTQSTAHSHSTIKCNLSVMMTKKFFLKMTQHGRNMQECVTIDDKTLFMHLLVISVFVWYS
jgi:hypothetical protein